METTTFKRLKVYGRNSLKTKEIDKKIEIWEIAFNFIYEIPLKKFGPKKSSPKKLKSPQNLNEKSFINWSDLEKKNYKRIPFKFDLGFILQGNPFTFLRLLDWFLKNPTKRVFLNFLIRTPNLSKVLNPQEICRDNFYFVYKYIWV